MKKILIASSSPPDKGSGINTYCKEIAQELRRRNIQVVFASPAPTDNSWLQEWQIEHYQLGATGLPKEAAAQLLHYIKVNAITAVINNDNAFLQMVAPWLSVPAIAVVHLSETNILSLACFNHAWLDHIVAISNEMREKIVNQHNVAVYKVPVIYNGIQDTFTEIAQQQRIVSEQHLTLVFNGGSNHRKGADLLKQTVTNNAAVWAHCTVQWYGTVSNADKKILSKLPHVQLMGRVPRDVMVKNLAEADLFLLPSRKEGCPMALIEAMAASNMALVSDGEGAMDVMISSGNNGFVLNLANWPQQCISTLDYLLANSGAVKRMKQQARKAYEQNFTVENTVTHLLSLIDSPTVNRAHKPSKIQLLKWHRPLKPGSNKAPFLDRIAIRFGLLRKAGWYKADKP